MTKITAEYLARGAFVYVRQSKADQVHNNHESRRPGFQQAAEKPDFGADFVDVQVEAEPGNER
jgi:hypothetical protein